MNHRSINQYQPTRMISGIALTVTSMLMLSSCASTPQTNGVTSLPTTVANVDLNQYQGKWYEIARLPMYFQRNCARDVTATYQRLPDGSIKVTNQCINKKGNRTIANGRAVVDTRYPHANNSKLLVSFLPDALQWLPVGEGSYWILALEGSADINGSANNYKHALVGSPNRKYLWILSRQPRMSSADYSKLINIANQQGYDTDALITSIHTPSVN